MVKSVMISRHRSAQLHFFTRYLVKTVVQADRMQNPCSWKTSRSIIATRPILREFSTGNKVWRRDFLRILPTLFSVRQANEQLKSAMETVENVREQTESDAERIIDLGKRIDELKYKIKEAREMASRVLIFIHRVA